jgi:hypothetical protein
VGGIHRVSNQVGDASAAAIIANARKRIQELRGSPSQKVVQEALSNYLQNTQSVILYTSLENALTVTWTVLQNLPR